MNFELVKNKNFALILFGNIASVFGDIFLNMGLALYVLKLTGSAEQFASILSLSVIPQLLFGLFSGIIVDRLDKKKTIIFLDLIRGIYLIILFSLMITGNLGITMIYITVMFFSLCDIFFGPSCIVILPLILKNEELVSGNTILNSLTEATKVLGAIIGTFIYGIYGLEIILIVDAITFFISAFSEFCMNFSSPKYNNKDSNILKNINDGLKMFFKDIRITSLVSNGILTHLVLFPFFSVGIPYVIINLLKCPNVYYGIVESTGTAALVLSAVIVSITKNRLNTAQSINLGIIGMLISVILFVPLGYKEFLYTLSNNGVLTVLYFGLTNFIMFLSFGYYLVFFVSFYQSSIPKEFLGRFGATMMLFFSLGRFLGFKLFGYLFNNENLIYAVIALGVGMLVKLIVHIPFMIKEREEKNRNMIMLKSDNLM